MMLPTWLVDALDRALPMFRGRERDELAALIVEAIPCAVVHEAIAHSAKTTLERRGICDGAGDLASSIAEAAGPAVIALLSIGEPACEECDGAVFVEHDAEGNEGPCTECRRFIPTPSCASCGAIDCDAEKRGEVCTP